MKLSDKFILKCNEDTGTSIPLGTKIKYLKPSINQQARGMMMWVFDHPFTHLGSSVGVKELLKKNKLSRSVGVGIIEIL